MNSLYIAIKSSIGRIGKTLIWMLLVTSSSFFFCFGFYLENLANNYREEIKLREIETYNRNAENTDQEEIDELETAWQYSGIAEMLMDISDKMLIIVYSSILVIVVLIAMIWVKDHDYDIGVYIVLGEKDHAIITKLLLEILLITIVSSLPAFLFSMFFLNMFGSKLIMMLRNAVGYQYLNEIQELDKSMLEYNLSALDLVRPELMLIILTLFVVFICSFMKVKAKYRNLFE